MGSIQDSKFYLRCIVKFLSKDKKYEKGQQIPYHKYHILQISEICLRYSHLLITDVTHNYQAFKIFNVYAKVPQQKKFQLTTKYWIDIPGMYIARVTLLGRKGDVKQLRN